MNNSANSRCYLLTVLLILLLSGLAGCIAPAVTPVNPTASMTESTGSVSPATLASETGATAWAANRPNAASGVLRLWWSKRLNLNPLLDISQSGLAINHLIYQGLFAIDASQQAQPALASQLAFSEDGLQATIQLNAGLVFHNGQALQAADVVACLIFIKAHAVESTYAAALNNVAAAEAIDAQTIRLTLSQPDPWLAWSLTYPVIPANRLSAAAFTLVAGTGPFQMTSYQASEGLVLSRVNGSGAVNELTTIRVLEFVNLAAAMQAFEADGLDLVSLSANEYSRYMLRNSLRFEQYTGNQCLFLAYNTQKKRSLADIGRLLFLKQLLLPDRLSLDGIGDWGECTAIPLPATSWRLGGQQANQRPMLTALGEKAWDPATRELVLLLPEANSFSQSLAKAIGGRLTAAGVKWKANTLPDAEYLIALQQGQYDLAILEAVLPDAPDATWLYRDDRTAAFALLNGLPSGSLAEYDIWRQRLLQLSQSRETSLEEFSFLKILNETAARSGWSVLLIRSAAVLYGDRVIGQCQPDRYNPLRGVEELWIWSGQSS